MTTVTVRPEASAILTQTGEADVPLGEVAAGKVTLDESWSPHVQATIDVPMPAVDVVNPILPQRVTLTASETVAPTSRVFDLGVRSRRAKDAETLTIELASDEALLMDKARLAATSDTTPRGLETSLRSICAWALGKIGATLLPGSADTPLPGLTRYYPLTNLATNPSAEVGVSDWAYLGGSSAFASVTMASPLAVAGTKAMRFTAAAGTAAIYAAGYSTAQGAVTAMPVQGGTTYTASLYAVGSTPRSAYISIMWRDAYGGVRGTVNGPVVPEVNGVWTRYNITATAPNLGIDMFGAVTFTTTGNSAGQFHYVDAVMFTEGDELVEYFDGDKGIPVYSYDHAWSGTPHLSTSARSLLPGVTERSREFLDWTPGQNLWDYLQPLCDSAGLVLYCDETRAWRLVSKSTHTVAGTITVTKGVNVTAYEDAIDRNGDKVATGVVILQPNGGIQFAGTDEKVVTIKPDGPRAYDAVSTLALIQRRSRDQNPTAFTDYTATPRQKIDTDLPGSAALTGRISSVVFDLAVGTMDIGTRDLEPA